MFSVLHRKVGSVFILSKTIISDFWTQSALTALHCAVYYVGHIFVCLVQHAVQASPVGEVVMVQTQIFLLVFVHITSAPNSSSNLVNNDRIANYGPALWVSSEDPSYRSVVQDFYFLSSSPHWLSSPVSKIVSARYGHRVGGCLRTGP